MPTQRPFQMPRQGVPGPLSELSRLAKAVERRDRFYAGDGISADDTAAGLSIAAVGEFRPYVRITGAPTGKAHPFTQVYETAPGTWTDVPAADRLTGVAYEVDGETATLTGRRVRLWLALDGEHWLFALTEGVTVGFTGTKTVVVAVSCLNETLSVTTEQWTFEDGLLKSVA